MNNKPDEKNRRVLVIDDNRAIHDDFRKILSPASATSTALNTVETALFGNSGTAVPPAPFELDSAFQGQEGVLRVKTALAAGRPPNAVVAWRVLRAPAPTQSTHCWPTEAERMQSGHA